MTSGIRPGLFDVNSKDPVEFIDNFQANSSRKIANNGFL
jgi:hypothetical protein